MFKKLSAPISVQWELTSWCNNACMHCYNYWRTGQRGELSYLEGQQAIHEATTKELVANKVFHTTLTGGEPLAVIRRYVPLIRLVRDAGLSIHMNTTLVMLTPGLADLLLDLNVSSLLVSLISADERTHDAIAQRSGAFKETVRGIELALSKGLHVAVNMVVTKGNLNTLRQTGKFASNLGVAAFCATKASAPPNCPDFSPYRLTSDEFHQMLWDLLWIRDTYNIRVESLEHYPACAFPDNETRTAFGSRNCLAGKTGATIGFDGQIRPCSHAHVTYGNVLQGLQSAWEAIDEWRNGDMVPTTCESSCEAYALQTCGGGCRIDAYTTQGDIKASDPYCLGRTPTTVRNREPLPSVPLDARFEVPQGVRFRAEDFGYVLFRSPSKWTVVDRNMYTILRGSDGWRPFGVQDIVGLYGVSEAQAARSVQHLLSRQLARTLRV